MNYNTNSRSCNSDFEKQLIDCGFVVDNNVDELKLIKYNLLAQRFDSSHMTLTIAPTMSCNFRCSYCFEKNQYHDIPMSEATILKLIDFVASRVKSLKKLTVLWFGGEPLLALDIIKTITHHLIDLCSKNNVIYAAGMSTNGYSLTSEAARLLRSYSINNLSITIDGVKAVHDFRRPLIDGRGTFDTIINNILVSCKSIPIDIRINIDRHNIVDLSSLMAYLKEKHILSHTNITISLAPIQDFDNNESTDYCLTDESFRELQLQFILKYQLPLASIYPSSKGCYCQADHYNSYCIDPHGDIYKCLSDIGIASRKISSIYGANLCNYDLFDRYMLFDATTDKKCSNCKFLPICMGGCPFFRIKNRNICDYQKHSLEDYMIAYARVSTTSKQLY